MVLNCRDRQCERLALKEPPSCAGTSRRNVSGPLLSPTLESGAPWPELSEVQDLPFYIPEECAPFKSPDPCSGSSWGRQSHWGLICGAGMVGQEPWLLQDTRPLLSPRWATSLATWTPQADGVLGCPSEGPAVGRPSE